MYDDENPSELNKFAIYNTEGFRCQVVILCFGLLYIVKNTKFEKCEIFHFLNVLRPGAECIKYNNDDHLMNPCLQQHNCLNL